MTSFEGFYKKTIAERVQILKQFAGLSEEECALLQKEGGLELAMADRMIENVAGTLPVPLGFATNFQINGREYVVPMAIEEPSVVAAASNAAKLSRDKGGFSTTADEPIMIGQIQLVQLANAEEAKKRILGEKSKLISFANELDPAALVKFGGGLKDIEARVLETQRGKMLIVHLLVDCRDAMGANAVNTLGEALTPKLEGLSGGKARLRIISNLAIHRKARAKAVWSTKALEESTKGEMRGEEVVERILDAYAFAAADEFRCTTHNKGIMNGIDAVVVATGNDWRAIEAGAHAFAAQGGRYKPLTKYSKNADGNLVGEIELPMAVGLVGGATKTHPIAKIAVKILGVKTASELAQVIAAVGLAQNFAALRALATTGIQAGHMKLHARNIAVMAGATGEEIEIISKKMAEGKKIRVDYAEELLG